MVFDPHVEAAKKAAQDAANPGTPAPGTPAPGTSEATPPVESPKVINKGTLTPPENPVITPVIPPEAKEEPISAVKEAATPTEPEKPEEPEELTAPDADYIPKETSQTARPANKKPIFRSVEHWLGTHKRAILEKHLNQALEGTTNQVRRIKQLPGLQPMEGVEGLRDQTVGKLKDIHSKLVAKLNQYQADKDSLSPKDRQARMAEIKKDMLAFDKTVLRYKKTVEKHGQKIGEQQATSGKPQFQPPVSKELVPEKQERNTYDLKPAADYGEKIYKGRKDLERGVQNTTPAQLPASPKFKDAVEQLLDKTGIFKKAHAELNRVYGIMQARLKGNPEALEKLDQEFKKHQDNLHANADAYMDELKGVANNKYKEIYKHFYDGLTKRGLDETRAKEKAKKLAQNAAWQAVHKHVHTPPTTDNHPQATSLTESMNKALADAGKGLEAIHRPAIKQQMQDAIDVVKRQYQDTAHRTIRNFDAQISRAHEKGEPTKIIADLVKHKKQELQRLQSVYRQHILGHIDRFNKERPVAEDFKSLTDSLRTGPKPTTDKTVVANPGPSANVPSIKEFAKTVRPKYQEEAKEIMRTYAKNPDERARRLQQLKDKYIKMIKKLHSGK